MSFAMMDVSSYLCNAREQAGMSLAQVAAVTRIPLQSLESLEQGRWSALPQPVFVRGFVTAFCRAVGVPEAPALDALPKAARPEPGVALSSVVTRGEAVLRPYSPSGARPSSTNVAYLAIVLVFVVGLLLAVFAMGRKTSPADLSRAVSPPTSPWSVPDSPARQ